MSQFTSHCMKTNKTFRRKCKKPKQAKNRDASLIMGDPKGKIGDDKTGLEDITGKEGVGDTNEKKREFLTDLWLESEIKRCKPFL
ncbi:hypothetical protein PoB_003617800 [Plakobranchus ocellatus]|uniref:Uncharacterized protein n=1 Tax=Plakobranchus ocellatus TaxID=259542 RepID=A0AAV4ASX6_9GAST|nr:hypothetical protein PoB_003617800 [Plakobranchus ocellatus]